MPAGLRTFLVTLFVGISLGIAPHPAIGQSEDVRRPYLAGNGFLARGMNALAVEEYRKFLAAHPDHDEAPNARYGLGVALQRLGRNEEAIRALDGLEQIDGFAFANESRIVEASAAAALGRQDDVVELLAPMIEHAPESTLRAAAPLLLEALHRTGEYQDTVRDAERIADRFSDRTVGARGALFAALAAERLGEDEDASVWAQRCLEHSEGDDALRPIAHLCQARIALRSGDNERAIQLTERLARDGAASVRSEALPVLAEALRSAGRIDDADRVYARIQAESPDAASGGVEIQRGVIAFEQGRFEEALRHFRQGDDGSESDSRWTARCLQRLDRPGEAARRLASIEDPTPGALYELGAALKASGDLEGARAAYERFMRGTSRTSDETLESLRPHAALAIASIDHAQGRYDECAARCRGLASDGGIGDASLRDSARLLLAECLYLKGDLDGAKDAYRACLDAPTLSDRKPSIAYRLGMIYASLGDSATAETVLRSVTRGDSTPKEFLPGLRTLGDLAMSREDWRNAIDSYAAYFRHTDDEAAPTRMMLGVAYARVDEPRNAIEALDLAIDGDLSDPQRARAHLERGDARLALGDSEGAASDWRTAMELDERRGAIRTAAGYRLSESAIASGDTSTAQRQLSAIIETTSDPRARATAMLDLGRLQLRDGDADLASATLSGIALEQLPADRKPEALACRSIASARAGDDRGAASADRQLDAMNADIEASLLTPLLYERAWRHRRAGDTDAAMEVYERLLNESGDPEVSATASLELADLLMETGDPSGAIARLQEAITSGAIGEDAADDASIRLGTLLYNAGDDAAAVEALQGVLERSDPDDRSLDSVRLICGESLHRLQLWASAVTQFDIASRSEERSIAEPALLRLGSSAAELGQWRVSESAFNRYIDRFPEASHEVTARFGVGWAREASGNPEGAIEAYRIAANGRSETAARAQFQIGECLFALGRHGEAAAELIKVDLLYASPRWSAAALYEAGRCFDAAGDHAQAIEQWRLVLQNPDAGDWAPMARARLGEAERTRVVGSDASERTTNDID